MFRPQQSVISTRTARQPAASPPGLSLTGQHAAFNGTPYELKSANGLMGSLQQQAADMMAGTTTDGVCVGPSFEWQPTE